MSLSKQWWGISKHESTQRPKFHVKFFKTKYNFCVRMVVCKYSGNIPNMYQHSFRGIRSDVNVYIK
jgi:hypothetical protein